ncbi:unnamed protein product [Leptosia nina]|uniref:Uncharacterized protein n=1 Tax=Leptosia nina TaxID=320188 RepID=A0AAV1IWA0_9NEOP
MNKQFLKLSICNNLDFLIGEVVTKNGNIELHSDDPNNPSKQIPRTRRVSPFALQKKRIPLSTTTKGLAASTHLDSASRLEPNRCYWRAPLSPRASETQRHPPYGGTGRETVILVVEWRPTGRGFTKELDSDAHSLEGPVPKDCTAVDGRGRTSRTCSRSKDHLT